MTNIVLFLGAGFSRAFGFPVMNEFFSYARSLARLDDSEKTFLTDLQLEARASHATLAGEDDNLEHVLSLASVRDMEDGTSKFSQCCSILAKVFALPKGDDWRTDIEHKFTQLFGDVSPADLAKSGATITVITTNYDLIAEFGLSLIGFAPNIMIKGSEHGLGRVPKVGSLYSENNSRITLCKLHGSINWHFNETTKQIIIDDALIQGRNMRSKESFLQPRAWAASDLPAMIIPPTFFKPEWKSPLDVVWRRARQALAEANKVVFIGYSFPPSDTHMSYLIGSALAKNVNLGSFTIVDPRADAITKRLRGNDSRYGIVIHRKLESVEKAWEIDFSLGLGESQGPGMLVMSFG